MIREDIGKQLIYHRGPSEGI